MAIAEVKPAELARGPDLAAALKDSLLAAIIAFAIFFPTLGVKTQSVGGLDIVLTYRLVRGGHLPAPSFSPADFCCIFSCGTGQPGRPRAAARSGRPRRR